MRKTLNRGDNFGRLCIIEKVSKIGEQNSRWRCSCVCGKETTVSTIHLTSGHTKSCGCFEIENRISHNHSHTRTYRIWQAMRQRCQNQKHESFPKYGGAGISVCNSWDDSFEAFFSDMGECPPGKTIGRKDGSCNYEPNNCRWETYIEQNNNLRSNVIIQIGDEKKTAPQWSKKSGVPAHLIRWRFHNGWQPIHAVFNPVTPGLAYRNANQKVLRPLQWHLSALSQIELD